ncbi:MCE family protein [Rhodococcus sp. HNM0569]|uniref:MCE family protein n=1 Tax=Rhodococcus sp. HNM0569 TaxID=2716340 RepID=UPI00146A3059|nr:MCE family protein [Rhodococcus sp. HNM0569]
MTTRRTRSWGVTAIAVATTLSLSACSWDGLNSLPLPGTEGKGEDSYSIRIQMPNVTTLSPNSPVRVDDVTVGSVADIEVENWHALVTVRLNGDVDLPANTSAKIGQTSLLGSQHLELAAPESAEAQGRLEDGDVIPLDRAGAYPTTEQTLSSLSVVLNGGGLAQVQTITQELNNALDGRTGAIHDLLPRLDELTGSLDRQRGDIISAMEGIDRLSSTVQGQKDTIDRALTSIPPALDVLVDQRQNLTNALTELGKLSDTATRVIDTSGEDLKANLRNLTPVLRELANSGNSLTEVLSVLLTFPFPMKTLDSAIRGDFANLAMMIDMTNERLQRNFLTGTVLGSPEGALGTLAGVAGQAGNPLTPPEADAPAPAPAPQIPGLPEIPGLPAIPGLTVPGGGTP